MDFTGKVVIVTGAGRGLGSAIVKVLSGNGADVVSADISLENAQEVTAEIAADGHKNMAVSLDVTNEDSARIAVQEVVGHFGQVDVLVNNAGVIGAPGWEDGENYSEADWDLIYDVNVKGMARMTDLVSRYMKDKNYGKIVNISSIAGRQGTQTSLPYGVSKAGVINLTQYYALELAPFSINVNAVCPGMLWTPMWERIALRRAHDIEKYGGLTSRQIFDRTIQERIPLGREQTPVDIGHAVAFLASDFARNITGQSLNVSGGFFMN